MSHLQRPLVVALFAFLAGLLPALRFAPPPAVAVSGFVAILAAGLLLGSRSTKTVGPGRASVLLLLLYSASGATSGALARQEIAQDCRPSFAEGARLVASGELAASHRPSTGGAAQPLLPLLKPTFSSHPGCRGEIRVRLPPGTQRYLPGTLLAVAGTWRRFEPPARRSGWPRDPRFHGFVQIDSILHASPPDARANLPLAVRARADARLERLFPGHVDLVEALVLGRREYVDRELRERFSRAGLSHLLAISGMHVGLIAAAVLLIASLLRMPRRRAIIATLAFTWAYLLLIGAGPSALRSGTMISLALAASILQRPSGAAPMVAAAAFLIIAFRPMAVLDPGFQLSFAGISAILLLREPLLSLAPDEHLRRGPVRGILEAVAVGIAAFIATAPIVAHHFGIIAPVSIVAGLPAVPLMSLALIGALLAMGVDFVAPPLAALLADGAALSLELLDFVATTAAAIPYGNATLPGPPWWSWSIAGAAGAAAWHRVRSGGPRMRWIAGAGAVLVTLTFWPVAVRAAVDGLQIHFIDVGQGDAIAIRTPNARWVLVDTGPASSTFDAGERIVLPFLRSQAARRVEALVLTHPDLDHIGGAGAVLRHIPVRYVFEPGLAVGKDSYLDLLRDIETEGTEWRAVRSGRTMELDGVRFEFLWPDAQTVDATEDANQISAILKVSYGEFSLLLTGDVGVDVEELLVGRHGSTLDVDVLKLGHHGSSTSTSRALLEVSTPELAIVSAGRRNRYGHPARSVLARVDSAGIAVARTDTEGTISLDVSPAGRSWMRQEW